MLLMGLSLVSLARLGLVWVAFFFFVGINICSWSADGVQIHHHCCKDVDIFVSGKDVLAEPIESDIEGSFHFECDKFLVSFPSDLVFEWWRLILKLKYQFLMNQWFEKLQLLIFRFDVWKNSFNVLKLAIGWTSAKEAMDGWKVIDLVLHLFY